MTVGRAALLVLMRRYLGAVMDPFVTLLKIHKLMYFMQEAGEDLNRQYAKGPYGPYATKLRHALTLLEGHYVKLAWNISERKGWLQKQGGSEKNQLWERT